MARGLNIAKYEPFCDYTMDYMYIALTKLIGSTQYRQYYKYATRDT